MYVATTSGIAVSVRPVFLAEHSSVADQHYVWLYDVLIDNQGALTVQLITRHWNICDSSGNRQQICGQGVVGEQPVLRPGESFRYQSGCPLATPSGIMQGHYEMQTTDGRLLKVAIPAFSLDSPFDSLVLN
jgi:ApaG protein